MTYSVIVWILLILFHFCRKTIPMLHTAFTDNLSSSGFASTDLPKQRFFGRCCKCSLPVWHFSLQAQVGCFFVCLPPSMTFNSMLLEWSWLLNIPPYWMFLWKILKYSKTLIAWYERSGCLIWLHQLPWKGNWYGQKALKVLLRFPFLFSAAGAFGQALWQDCKYHWNWSWVPMLIESNLYLSTSALKLWKQMLSAVQKHSDKFMRSLARKWIQNYLAGTCPPSSLREADMLEQYSGSETQKETRLVFFQNSLSSSCCWRQGALLGGPLLKSI